MNTDVDPEYHWIIRTCMNGINILLTMLHLIIHDNAASMQPEYPRKNFINYL